MKFKGIIGSQHSGSVNGLTFSHNTYGQYVRARVIPTNPNSTRQQLVRTQMQDSHDTWLALPQATKDAWNAYAAQTPIYDRLGNAIHLTGRLMYLRDYVLRHSAGRSGPPVVVKTMGLTQLGYANPAVTAPNAGTVTFDNGVAWAIKTGGFLFGFASRGKGQGINFYRGPYALAVTVVGNTASPPTSPQNFTMPYNVQAGQKVFFRFIATDEEGRLSEESFQSCTAS